MATNLIDELITHLAPLGVLAKLNLEPLRAWFRETSDERPTAADDGKPTVGLARAGELVAELAAHQSVLLVSPPGVGKTDVVAAAARRAGLRCHSLLGTQLAPEDLTGVPRIEGERTVFYPPRVVLPTERAPFCLFLDELPAAAPDVQKAMYSLLLERRIGEHALPAGSWVVAAGNRVEDAALVRQLSSALVNRLFVLHVRPSVREWLAWADAARVRDDIRAFIRCEPDALLRAPRDDGEPFSSPRAWASLGAALDRVAAAGLCDAELLRALAHGRVSPADADRYCAFVAAEGAALPGHAYLANPDLLPDDAAARWRAVAAIREAIARGELLGTVNARKLFAALGAEERSWALSGLVPAWLRLVGPRALRDVLAGWLREVEHDAEARAADDARVS